MNHHTDQCIGTGESLEELVAAGKYRLKRRIHKGRWRDVWLVSLGDNQHVVKIEPSKCRDQFLEYEAMRYHFLRREGIEKGIPAFYHFGSVDGYKFMVVERLGRNLEDIFNSCGRKFSLKTVLLLADQLISRIESIHDDGDHIHRDFSPENLLMGTGNECHQVNVIGFRLAMRYRDSKTHDHIKYREGRTWNGTARYASINNHLGVQQSRRDDMESLGYVFLYFLGLLPWVGLTGASTQDKLDRVKEKKMNTSVRDLCCGAPAEFATYLEYTRGLGFEDRPDYSYLKQLLRDLAEKESIEYDGKFDFIE